MDEKTIYLHIGAPKTGTTTIQRYLVENCDVLKDEGYLIPSQSRKENINHIYLANYAIDEDKMPRVRIICNTKTVEQVRTFRKKFRRQLRGEILRFNGRNIVFSNEHCFKFLTSIHEVTRLRELFEGLFSEIKIVLYIREQSELLCSHYSTAVKNNYTQPIKNIEEFSESLDYNFNEKLRPWEEVFGIENITLRIFDRATLIDRDIISDFCHVTGMNEHKSRKINMNVSLNAKQCEFLRIINTHLPNLKNPNGFKARRIINKMVTETRIESPPVSDLITHEYQEVFENCNREIVRRYFKDGRELFGKKVLSEAAIDQSALLTDADKENLFSQIALIHGRTQVRLCKCLAAIFGIRYRGRIIPGVYIKKYNKYLIRNKPDIFGLMKKHVIRIIRR
jgi:hypothetical protein